MRSKVPSKQLPVTPGGHTCPVCMRGETVSQLCQIGEYTIFTCAFCKSDHTWPTPSAVELKQYYDRPEWFTGGERGGYRDYDAQTAWSLDIYDGLLAKFSAQLSPSVLDVGCGYGSHLTLAKSRGWKCFGIELSEHARGIALERLAGEAHIVERVEDMLPHRFDLITIFDTIEHLASPYQLLFALFALGAIDEQTMVVFTSPNAGSVTAKSDPAQWAYRHPPSHLTYYSADSFKYLLKVLRFQDVVIQGVSAIESGTELDCFDGLLVRARGSDFAAFMQERYVPGTWSKVAEYEHVPRYTLASRYVKARRALDFGCGTGYGASMLSRTATSVLGLDIDSDAIVWARNWHRQSNLSFLQTSDFGDELPSGSFDVATCFEMIEHVNPASQERTIASIARLLGSQGMLVISTPNPEVTQLYGANPYHLRELSRVEFDALLRQHFCFVQMIDQSAHAGVIFRSSDDLTVSRASPIDASDLTPIRPLAFVAICSQSTLPALNGELYYDAANDYVHDFVLRQTAVNRLKYENYTANESLTDLHRRLAQQTSLGTVVSRLENASESQSAEIHRLNGVVVEKDAAVEQQSAEIGRLYAVVLEREAALTQQTQEVRRLNVVVIEKDAAVEQQSAEIRRLNVVVVEKDAAVDQQSGEIRRLYAVVLEREAALTQQTQEVRRLNEVVVEKDAALQALTVEIRRLEESVLGLRASLDKRAERIAALESLLSERERISEHLTSELSGLRGHLGDTMASLRHSKQSVRDLTHVSQGWEARHLELSQSQWVRLGNALNSRPFTLSSATTAFATTLSLCTPKKVKELLGRVRKRSSALRNSEVYVTEPLAGARADGEPYRIRTPKPVNGRRPRVLHVIANFCTGGSSRLIVDLIEQLGGEYEHSVLTSFIPVPPAYSGVEIQEIRSHGHDQPFIRQLVEYAPDVVHVHYWGDCDEPWYARAIDCAGRLGFPIVENINTPVEPYINASVVRYVFVSDYVRTQFGHQIPDGITVHPGSDFTFFSGDLSRSPTDCVGMVYRLERDKLGEDAILPFIALARLRPKVRFLIVGGGSLLEPFKQATRDANVERQFEFTGYVAYERLPQLYSRMSIFVAPVWKESFGQVSPFAMSMGVAVCGYDVGALREITGTPETLAPAGDHERLAEIIAQLLDAPSKRQDIAQRQNDRALQHFSLDAMISAYRRIYGEVCDPGRTA